MKRKNRNHRHFRPWHLPILVTGILVAGLVILYLIIHVQPSLGAKGADILRSVVGDKAVARFEMVYNQVTDAFQILKFKLGWSTPGVGWEVQPTMSEYPVKMSMEALISPTPTLQADISTLTLWPPKNVSPISSMPGEGEWEPYILDAQGNTVAYRTYLQPVPDRPFAPVAVVAFDLDQTRLHYILGVYDPVLPGGVHGDGEIPLQDLDPGVLLATFNGGFKARHGEFGAMADGITALPPREGLGTLVIFQDGSVSLGEWGRDLWMSDDIQSFRQNGPLVVQNGRINPRIYNNSPLDWGYTVIDVSPTVRSGLGLNFDDNILYYFCGPGLSMEDLAKVMVAVEVENAIQLDINTYWVLFIKVIPYGNGMNVEPLFPQWMSNVNRYILTSARDFFYVTGIVE